VSNVSVYLADLVIIAVISTVVVFALAYKPNISFSESAVFESGNQLKFALMGLILTIGILALVISSFIPRERWPAAPR